MMGMRNFALLIILLAAGCSTSIGDSQEGTVDARPIDFRETPDEKEGTGTAPGCDGITARGECQQGTAVYCDLERGRKRTVDCQALGQDCILDIGRGAVCKSLQEDTGTGSGAESPCTDTGISEIGFCTADGTAVYCDTSGTEPVTRTWDCGSVNKVCAVGQADCATGAFCCGDGTEPDPEPVTDCGTVDFNGSCEGDTATWCSPTQGLQTLDCAADNKRCEVDTCATGAYCCGATAEATPEQLMCAELGLAGECNADNTAATYCLFDEIITSTCTGTKVCEVDTCGFGAVCCEPPADPPANECTTIGYAGVCKDETTVRFCVGTEDEDIIEFSCTDGKTCQVDESGDANCREVVDPCADLDAVGVCEGNTLRYCIGDNLTETDCGLTNKMCEVDTCLTGMANCCVNTP